VRVRTKKNERTSTSIFIKEIKIKCILQYNWNNTPNTKGIIPIINYTEEYSGGEEDKIKKKEIK
jgi:hypothetical protein